MQIRVSTPITSRLKLAWSKRRNGAPWRHLLQQWQRSAGGCIGCAQNWHGAAETGTPIQCQLGKMTVTGIRVTRLSRVGSSKHRRQDNGGRKEQSEGLRVSG